MNKRFYLLTRDLHLYLGLFLAPFILLFSVSVFFLAHAWIPGQSKLLDAPRSVANLALPANLESLGGRDLVEAMRTALPAMGVAGEIGFVRHILKERRFIFSVTVPGRETAIDLNVPERIATITKRDLGTWDGLAALHKSPGQHLAAIRMNWFPMRAWRWFADGTVYLLLFISISGIYLWAVLRAERRAGLALLAAGALTFIGMVYAVVH